MELQNELEKNEIYRKKIYIELEVDKKKFADDMRNHISKEIKKEFQERKEIKKESFWDKLLKIFK